MEQKSEERLFTLTRGNIAPDQVSVTELAGIFSKDETNLSASKLAVLEKARMASILKLCDKTKPGDYSGIFHSAHFQVNRSIVLQSLGFWGPFKEDRAEYEVTIQIFELSTIRPSPSQKAQLLIKLQDKISADRKQLFLVQLQPQPIIEADRWIKIEFMLNGPKTYRCDRVKMECNCEDGTVFNFSTSSRQMPVINYKMHT